MTTDAQNRDSIMVGMTVVGFNGDVLGKVHEAHPHYILVGQEGQHVNLEIPAHAIIGVSDGTIRVHVNRQSSTPVDDTETVHNLKDEG